MVGIAGPSGGRFCAKTHMGAAAASKSNKNKWKLMPLRLRPMIQSPLRIADPIPNFAQNIRPLLCRVNLNSYWSNVSFGDTTAKSILRRPLTFHS
jgi:hypothetical protein